MLMDLVLFYVVNSWLKHNDWLNTTLFTRSIPYHSIMVGVVLD